MTLLDAHPYDPAQARRRKIKIAVTVIIVVALAALAWMYRNWPEEHSVDKFFAALQRQDYETAYAIYFNDPTWQKHQQKYSQYTARITKPPTPFISTIPPGKSISRNILSTLTRTSIATGDRAASGALSSPTESTDRPTRKVLAAEGS